MILATDALLVKTIPQKPFDGSFSNFAETSYGCQIVNDLIRRQITLKLKQSLVVAAKGMVEADI